MIVIADILIALSLVIGGLFSLVGAFGLLKLDTPMSRVHAPTKSSTLGVGAMLIASMIQAFAYGEGSLHELLIMAFIFGTAPITAHFIAKVHIHTVGTDPLPKPPLDTVWATRDTTNVQKTDPKPIGMENG